MSAQGSAPRFMRVVGDAFVAKETADETATRYRREAAERDMRREALRARPARRRGMERARELRE